MVGRDGWEKQKGVSTKHKRKDYYNDYYKPL
jgi:hypothetical protein